MDELLMLMSLAAGPSTSTNSGHESSSDRDRSSILRHVPNDRLWELLSHMKVKSLLFTPLSDPTKVETTDIPASNFSSFNRLSRAGLVPATDARYRACDVLVKSMCHRFSVFGHRTYSVEDDEIVPMPVYCNVIDPSGRFVITGADDNLVKSWDVSTGRLIATMAGHTKEVCDICFSPCGTLLVSLCSEDFSVILWKRVDDTGVFRIYKKLVESDTRQNPPKNLSPLYMEFSPPDSPLGAELNDVKFTVAYTNGTIVVYSVAAGAATEFNRIVPDEKYELKSFATSHVSSTADSITLLAGISRGAYGKAVLCHTLRSRGTPRTAIYHFPPSANPKAPISHISPANLSASFVANDDDQSTVVMLRDTQKGDFEKLILLKGQISGDATLIDGSSLLSRLAQLNGGVPVSSSHHMRIVVDVTWWTLDDQFVLITIAGEPRRQSTIGEDDKDCVHCCLVFDSGTGMLVGAVGLGFFRDHVFNANPVDDPNKRLPQNDGWSYCCAGSYDGSIVFWKMRISVNHTLMVEGLTSFNINDRGAITERQVLDCQVLATPGGDIVCATSDSMGTLSVFSTSPSLPLPAPPSEQFFSNDYVPPEGFRTTTLASVGIALCDSRLVPVDQLEIPSFPVVNPVQGTGFASRLNAGTIDKQTIAFNVADIRRAERAETGEKEIGEPERVGPGRPRLDESDRRRREDRLRNLAAARAAAAVPREEEEEVVDVITTSSGRVVRRMSARVTHEEVEYENSEIDDSDFSAESDDSPRLRHRGTRSRPRDDSVEGERRGRGRPRRVEQEEVEQEVNVIPVKLRREEYVSRLRFAQSGNTAVTETCRLCTSGDSSSLLGPFGLADFGDSFFHPECLFSLTGLSLVSTRPELVFANLESLVHAAVRQHKCAWPGCARRTGAGIKCCACSRWFHYSCSKKSQNESGWLLDPLLDSQFLCHRCDPPRSAEGLLEFSKRRKWRNQETVRSWVLGVKPPESGFAPYVPQIGDLVYYYPPSDVVSGPGSARLRRAAAGPRPVPAVCDGGKRFMSACDLSVLSWCDLPFIPAKVEAVEYIYPSCLDAQEFGVIQRVTLTIVPHASSHRSAVSFEGLRFVLHYRPRANASDSLVLQSRVDAAVQTRFHLTASIGDRVAVPTEDSDAIVGTIVDIKNDLDRPGWECFEVSCGDSTILASLWELNLTQLHSSHSALSQGLSSSVSFEKSSFLARWVERISQGSVKSSRNRIDIPDGVDIFAVPPWTTEGGQKYLEYIPYPVWLELIKLRLTNQYYRHTDEIRKDCMCILQNCEVFNHPDSPLVALANSVATTLVMLVNLPEADHVLYTVPPANNRLMSIRVSPRADRATAAQSSTSSSSVRVSSIRITAKAHPEKTLRCGYCNALRSVEKRLFDEFTSLGKRVKCRYLGYVCDPPPAAIPSQPPPVVRQIRASRPPPRELSSSSSDSSEDSDSDSIEDDSSDGSPKRRSSRLQEVASKPAPKRTRR